MARGKAIAVKIFVIALWAAAFSLPFRWPYVSALAQNASPDFLLSTIRHAFFYLLWLGLLLLVLAFFKGRFFCWHVCPVGLLQDLLPSRGRAHPGHPNRAVFLVLAGFAVFSVNLLVFFDPLVIWNRAVSTAGMNTAGLVIFLAPVVLILVMSLGRKRFWCFKLCPLGAFLDWVLWFRITLKKQGRMADIGRRNALLLLGSGLLGGLVLRRLNLRSSGIHSRLLRPPGALPENDFTDRCVRCGSCIGVCLTGGLQPALSEGGWEGVFSPRLVPEIGECDEFCNRCGQSCPTQAIRYLPLQKKRNFKLGTARVRKERCIAWSQDKNCLVCQEYCPYLAIEIMKNDNGTPCPLVIPTLCRGCGLCEKNCFASPVHAIMVYNDGAGGFIRSPENNPGFHRG